MAKKTGKAGSRRKRKAATVQKVTAKKIPARTKAAPAESSQPRQAKRQTPRLPKQAERPVDLPSVRQLTETAALTLWRHRRLFIGITLVYGLLNLILVQGLANSADVASLKTDLSQGFSGHPGSLVSGLGSFVALFGSAGSGSSQTGSTYQLLLVLIASLAVIWALRQISAGLTFRVRDAYYRGMYPLVPFILVLLVVGLQLIPLIVGSAVYAVVSINGIAIYFIEKLLWLLLFGLLALCSLYMLSSSVFALYIVTLPDMTPIKALRSAKELSRRRRWVLLRKILCLPVILVVVTAVIIVPVIFVVTPLARWVFFLLTISSLTAVHAYMYTLYRELLNE